MKKLILIAVTILSLSLIVVSAASAGMPGNWHGVAFIPSCVSGRGIGCVMQAKSFMVNTDVFDQENKLVTCYQESLGTARWATLGCRTLGPGETLARNGSSAPFTFQRGVKYRTKMTGTVYSDGEAYSGTYYSPFISYG